MTVQKQNEDQHCWTCDWMKEIPIELVCHILTFLSQPSVLFCICKQSKQVRRYLFQLMNGKWEAWIYSCFSFSSKQERKGKKQVRKCVGDLHLMIKSIFDLIHQYQIIYHKDDDIILSFAHVFDLIREQSIWKQSEKMKQSESYHISKSPKSPKSFKSFKSSTSSKSSKSLVQYSDISYHKNSNSKGKNKHHISTSKKWRDKKSQQSAILILSKLMTYKVAPLEFRCWDRHCMSWNAVKDVYFENAEEAWDTDKPVLTLDKDWSFIRMKIFMGPSVTKGSFIAFGNKHTSCQGDGQCNLGKEDQYKSVLIWKWVDYFVLFRSPIRNELFDTSNNICEMKSFTYKNHRENISVEFWVDLNNDNDTSHMNTAAAIRLVSVKFNPIYPHISIHTPSKDETYYMVLYTDGNQKPFYCTTSLQFAGNGIDQVTFQDPVTLIIDSLECGDSSAQ